MTANAATRFSNRVENYIKYRPSYPEAALEILERECNVKRGSVVADLGSGTGIFSKLLLQRGCSVFAVEPNREMRKAAERWLSSDAHFTSINGSAESTTLSAQSVDAVTAAQAFHWFDIGKARAECKRILKPNGYVALLFNDRLVDATPFLEGYEELLLRYATDYKDVNPANIGATQVEAFFGHNSYARRSVPNAQRFDFTGLRGRLESSSYAPTETHANYAPMITELKRLFDAFEQHGTVEFLYETKLYFGQLC